MWSRFIAAVVFFLLPGYLFAQGDVAQLHLHLSGAQTLTADFTQRITDADGALVQESSGSIALKRPNKLRWESKKPFHYLLVTDGDTLWRYDADLDQLNVEDFDPSLAQAPAMIIGASIEQLEENFSVSLDKQGSERAFTLTPKTESNFASLTLSFKSGKLTGMSLLDSLEQRTDIQFVNPRYNGKLADNLFTYQNNSH